MNEKRQEWANKQLDIDKQKNLIKFVVLAVAQHRSQPVRGVIVCSLDS